MRKFIFLLAIVLLFVPEVNSVSSTLRDSYAPKETMIGELSGILAPINREQVRVVKDGHLDVAVQYGVAKLGNKYYIWIVAPSNAGNYDVIIDDVVSMVNGIPEVADYRKNFSVQGNMVNYSIVPGTILANDDFVISVIDYNAAEIEVSFPEQRTISLYPGTNEIDFSIANVLGTQQIPITIGMYQVPAYIFGNDYVCGDGRIDDREVCDGTNLNGKDCTKVPGNFTGGILKCSSSCLVFDTSSCESGGNVCGSAYLNLCLSQASCVGAGGFWYNNICNKYDAGAACDSNHLDLCAQGNCATSGGFWYNNFCNEEEVANECGDGIVELGEECDRENLNGKVCLSLGYDGGELSCIAKKLANECRFNFTKCFLISKTPEFSVNPAVIRSKVLTGEGFPVYRFSVVNEGMSEIRGLNLDYNPAKFSVSPSGNVTIGVNESVNFDVTVRDSWRGTPFKGVIIVYAGDVYEYVLLDINFTSSASDAGTQYTNGSSQPSYYCSELSGLSCSSGENCNGNLVDTIDVNECCVGSCEKKSGGGNSWIGYFIAGVVLLVLVFIFLKYRKAGKGGSPLQEGILKAEKNMP